MFVKTCKSVIYKIELDACLIVYKNTYTMHEKRETCIWQKIKCVKDLAKIFNPESGCKEITQVIDIAKWLRTKNDKLNEFQLQLA